MLNYKYDNIFNYLHAGFEVNSKLTGYMFGLRKKIKDTALI